MFEMNKETIMMISIAVALFAIFYVYRDVQKTKIELKNLSDKPDFAAVPPGVPKKKISVPQPVPVTPPPVADEAN